MVTPVADEGLEGGITNAGAVVRDGDQVIRLAGPNAASVHDFLTEVRGKGFTGVPASFGIDGDGRHRLEFIDGDVSTCIELDYDACPSPATVATTVLHDGIRARTSDRYTPEKRL